MINNRCSNKNEGFKMKRLRVMSLLLAGLFVASTAGVVTAQNTGDKPATSVTREQVKMERDEFLRTHEYDPDIDNWVLKPGIDAPTGMKPRADVKAERNDFLRNNRWDDATSSWVSLKGKPRKMSTLSREQVRNETRQFNRTHRYDEINSTWVAKPVRTKKK
jgi:hypothetical protein